MESIPGLEWQTKDGRFIRISFERDGTKRVTVGAYGTQASIDGLDAHDCRSLAKALLRDTP